MSARMRKCGNCGEKAVGPVVLESYKTSLEHDGQSYDLELVDFPVNQCANCKTVVPGEESEERLSNALRAAADVLTPIQIREHRKSLNLTQVQLAEYLRLSPSTISRWESGAQIQQRSMDVLLRAFFEVPEFRIARKYPESQIPWQQVPFTNNPDTKSEPIASLWGSQTIAPKSYWPQHAVQSSQTFLNRKGLAVDQKSRVNHQTVRLAG